jgi:two-component system phosphate regulon response regulator OmpR
MRDQPLILIADDEVPIANFVADALRDEGYAVSCVHDGASVLLAIQSEQPDLVIIDNAMPVMTGDEVLRVARDQGFEQPIIMMSAHMRADRFREHGATAFLAKPFTLDVLLDTVAAYLDDNDAPGP